MKCLMLKLQTFIGISCLYTLYTVRHLKQKNISFQEFTPSGSPPKSVTTIHIYVLNFSFLKSRERERGIENRKIVSERLDGTIDTGFPPIFNISIMYTYTRSNENVFRNSNGENGAIWPI